MHAKAYNGHHCWSCWNVSLWLGNEESLCRAALSAYESAKPGPDRAGRAARRFLRETGFTQTPDGAKCSVTAVRRAIVGLTED